jgi:hypothetical protein
MEGTYVLHEHTFPCQGGNYPFTGEPSWPEHAEEVLAPVERREGDKVRDRAVTEVRRRRGPLDLGVLGPHLFHQGRTAVDEVGVRWRVDDPTTLKPSCANVSIAAYALYRGWVLTSISGVGVSGEEVNPATPRKEPNPGLFRRESFFADDSPVGYRYEIVQLGGGPGNHRHSGLGRP